MTEKQCQRVGTSLRAAGGYRRAAEAIEAFKERHGIATRHKAMR